MGRAAINARALVEPVQPAIAPKQGCPEGNWLLLMSWRLPYFGPGLP
jgi:hypothetical protein